MERRNGLFEQINLHCIKPYIKHDFSADSLRILASNTALYFFNQGIIDIEELSSLRKLIDSPDTENTILAFSVLEEKEKINLKNLNACQ